MLSLDDRREIVYLRGTGLSLAEIGRRYGVTRERIRQIVGDRVTVEYLREQREAAYRQMLVDAGYDLAAVSDETGRSIDYLRGLLTEEEQIHSKNLHPRPTPTWITDKWSESQTVDALRQAADYYGGKLTAAKYGRLVRLGMVEGPSVPRLFQKYGSWLAVCELAGVQPGGGNHGGYTSNWTDRQLEDAVRVFLSDSSLVHSFNNYERWARENGKPSGGTIRNRLGAWAPLMERLRHG